jgi:membrane-associated HD superfamily phosphohydrolase
MKFSEIEEKINSDDIKVLKICESFIDDRLEKENARGESAERRANMVLGTVGAGTILMVFWSKMIIVDDADSAGGGVMLFYTICSLLLVKAIWYAVKSSTVQSRYQIPPENIFELSELSELQGLKFIISSKYYECFHAIQPNSDRLFYVQRAQRALISFFVGALLLGGASSLNIKLSDPMNIAINSVMAVFSLIWFLRGDWCVERVGIWNSKPKK